MGYPPTLQGLWVWVGVNALDTIPQNPLVSQRCHGKGMLLEELWVPLMFPAHGHQSNLKFLGLSLSNESLVQ